MRANGCLDGDVDVRHPHEPPPMIIKMSNGKTVDHPDAYKTHGPAEFSTSPPSASPWSPSASGYHNGPFPRYCSRERDFKQKFGRMIRPTDRRPGYGASPYPSPWTENDPPEIKRPVEVCRRLMGFMATDCVMGEQSAQQTATYDSLLREAQTLRRDLEKEFNLNRGSKVFLYGVLRHGCLPIAFDRRR